MPRKKIPHKVQLTVVGIQHRLTMTTRRMIAAKIEETGPIKCKVIREPENEKDANALKVVIAESSYKRLHLGYLVRSVAALYSPLIDKGEITLSAGGHLTSLEPRDGEGEILLMVKARYSKSLETRLKFRT